MGYAGSVRGDIKRYNTIQQRREGLMRTKIRQLVLLIMVVDFPLLYLSTNTPEATVMTVATLAVMGVAAAAAVVVY